MVERHLIEWALPFAVAKAGKSSPAKMAMIAITINSSISVKAALTRDLLLCS